VDTRGEAINAIMIIFAQGKKTELL
jgi:hypothetical protein